MSNIWRLTRPRLKRLHPNDNHKVQYETAGTIHVPAASDCSPKRTCYSCSGVALGEALGSVVVPSSVVWRCDFLVELDGLPLVSSLDSPVRASVALSLCRRDDGVTVALLVPDGDSPRVALRVGLAVAAGEPVAAGLADAVAVGDVVTPGEAVAVAGAVAIGDAVAPGEAVAVDTPPVAVVPVVVVVPVVPLTPDVPTPIPTPPETP